MPCSSTLHGPLSNTRLITDVQTVAGIISLLNDYRISKGDPPLGFLNTWLYGRGRDGLQDIKDGSNPGCDTLGFPAMEGWGSCSSRQTCITAFSTLGDLCTIGHGSRDAEVSNPAGYIES